MERTTSSKRGAEPGRCGPKQHVTVSWCESSHAADKQCVPPRGEATETRPAARRQPLTAPLQPAAVCVRSLGCRGQREATYLLHVVRPYRVRGGETDRTEEGGEWNCGTVGGGTVQR